jgi:hypothetical protein
LDDAYPGTSLRKKLRLFNVDNAKTRCELCKTLFNDAATIAGVDNRHEGERCQSRVSVVCVSRERRAKISSSAQRHQTR